MIKLVKYGKLNFFNAIKKIILTKSIYAGFCVLELSNSLLYELYHEENTPLLCRM